MSRSSSRLNPVPRVMEPARPEILPPQNCCFCGSPGDFVKAPGLNNSVTFQCMVCIGTVWSDMTDFYEVLYAPFECFDLDKLGVWRSVRKLTPKAFMVVVKNYEREALKMEIECVHCGESCTFLHLAFEPVPHTMLWRPPFVSKWQCDDPMCRAINVYNFPSNKPTQ